MPPPDDDDVGHDPAASASGVTPASARATTRSARAPRTVGSSFDAGRAGEGQAAALGAAAGLDVEVVQHLEVIGDEAAGAHQHARGRPVAGQLVDHGEDVRTEPRLGCPAGRLPRHPPAVPRARPASAATAAAVGAQLVGVRIARGQDPLGEAVGA